MQYFKGDDTEVKLTAALKKGTDLLDSQRDLFFSGATSAAPLGELIYDNLRSPLSNAITREIFRLSFFEIFNSFVEVGTFEAYIAVFKKIFGDDVDITFTIPAAGRLQIDIVSNDVELTNFVARYISDNQYVFDNVVDHLGNQIVFQSIRGFTSEYELEQMLFEMVPAGIFTEITLTL